MQNTLFGRKQTANNPEDIITIIIWEHFCLAEIGMPVRFERMDTANCGLKLNIFRRHGTAAKVQLRSRRMTIKELRRNV